MDLGPLAPFSEAQMDEFAKRLEEAAAHPGPLILLPARAVTCETATAGLSALSCPDAHARTVPVELAATGEKVAVLCLDCDRQLPAEWPTPESGKLGQ